MLPESDNGASEVRRSDGTSEVRRSDGPSEERRRRERTRAHGVSRGSSKGNRWSPDRGETTLAGACVHDVSPLSGLSRPSSIVPRLAPWALVLSRLRRSSKSNSLRRPSLSLAVADDFGGHEDEENREGDPDANADFPSGREVVSADLRNIRVGNVGGLSRRRVRHGKRSLTG